MEKIVQIVNLMTQKFISGNFHITWILGYWICTLNSSKTETASSVLL